MQSNRGGWRVASVCCTPVGTSVGTSVCTRGV